MPQTPKYLNREEQALAEAGKTFVSKAQKRLLALVFLATIFFAPLGQQVLDLRAYFAGSRKTIAPQCYDIFGSAFSAAKKIFKSDGGPATRLLEANRQLLRAMQAYEKAVEDNSFLGRTIRPDTQYLMARWLGAGNDKTYCGRRQWLFYRADVDGIMNHGFLGKAIMARRLAAESETRAAVQPDPRPAIIAFHKELAGRGIKLILLPTPVKPGIHPEKFAAGFDGFYKPLHNSSYDEFVRDLENEGILIFDPAPALVENRQPTGQDQFLARDTHWRPEAMELCARLTSGFIKEHVALAPAPAAGYTALETNIVQRGDLLAMLCLPENACAYGRESVKIRRIFDANHNPWQADQEAEVLVLGDSFSNIYSLEALGWGRSAGLVEQLSYELQRPIDRLAVNDNGAWSTRELLRKEIARGYNRLAGKRVVIWQFAERELSAGDWKILPLNLSDQGRARASGPAASLAGAGQASEFLKLTPGTQLVIRGRIAKIAKTPRPRSVPYADHIIAAHLVDVMAGANQSGPALVYLFSMTNNALTKAAGLQAGDTVELKLRSWSDVSAAYERINRTDLDDPDLLAQEPCWGELPE